MNILVAAGNRFGSFFQLERFLQSVKNQNHTIKIAAYKKSIGTLDIHYMLDALLNFTNPDGGLSFNGNYKYYYNEIKRFAPDLIISDCEIYTSIIALELKIKLWQVSPLLLYSALSNKLKNTIPIYKNHGYLLSHNLLRKDYLNYIINSSDRKFVLSHLCDIETRPDLIDGFEWIRPEFILGDNDIKVDYLVSLIKDNKTILKELKNKSVMITNNYKQYINSCNVFLSDGTATFLADAFYNQKYCFSIPRYDDIETVVAAYLNEYCAAGKTVSDSFNIDPPNVKIHIDDGVRFLSEYIKEM
jgi:hypothetical protein